MKQEESHGLTHILRPGGYQHRTANHVIGNFPMGAPLILRGDSTQWKLHKDAAAAVPARGRRNAQPEAAPWLLQDKSGVMTHRGQLEGGIATSNYFVLVKDGSNFNVLPVSSWYTFKPPPRRTAMTLEEAEAEMEKKHNSHFAGAGRLTQAIAKAEAEGLDAGPDEGGALGADSDEEEKRANRAKAAGADQSSRVEARNQGNNADVSIIKGDKAAEDWEYEENAADDDDDMGEQEDANNRDASPSPRRSPTSPTTNSPTASGEDDEAEDGRGLSKQGRDLQRLLKSTGLSESDSGGNAGEDDSLMTDDDDDDEIEDLDALAKGMERAPFSKSGKPPSAAETGKRRSPTPSSAVVKATAKRKADSDANTAGKRQRSGTPTSQAQPAGPRPAVPAGVKAEPTTSPAVKVEPSSSAPQGLVTTAEVQGFVRNMGGSVPATDLTRHFKARLNTKAEKDQFRHVVKTGLKFDKDTKCLGLGK